jgi:predicted sugar kinase
MFAGIKKAVEPSKTKTAPLKSKDGEVITDPTKQMERWVEHYLEVYGTERTECNSRFEYHGGAGSHTQY